MSRSLPPEPDASPSLGNVNDIVSAVRARALIAERMAPLLADMESVRDGTWARPLTDEIRAVVQISSLKGAEYDVAYGVCCTWVPVSGAQRRFGRFPHAHRQTVLHLWVDHFTLDGPPRRWVSTLGGTRTSERESSILAEQVMNRAPAWWQSASSPVGVLAEARRQASAEVDIHSPRARLVAAFTLARLGDITGARVELGDDDGQDLLAQVGTTPHH